jgi:hypothetical protein
MSAAVDDLHRTGDRAESALYRAQRRLAKAAEDADEAVLREWVAARQAELDAARSSVDFVTSAMANLGRMRALWEQRYAFMNDPESIDPVVLLQRVITEAAARAEKDVLEQRLNGLRSIELAHSRRLRDSGLSDDLREAMTGVAPFQWTGYRFRGWAVSGTSFRSSRVNHSRWRSGADGCCRSPR